MQNTISPTPPNFSRSPSFVLNEHRTLSSSSEKFNSLNEQFVKHAYKHDLEAQLVCKSLLDGHWSVFLTHIKGKKMEFLLGKNFELDEQLPLDQLLGPSLQKVHQDKLEAVLNKGTESKYWPHLFQNVIGRVVKVINPVLGVPRFVKLHIQEPQDYLASQAAYEFKVILIDQTAQHILVNQAGANSHDIRGLMRAGIRTFIDANFLALNIPDHQGDLMHQHSHIYETLQEQKELLKVCNEQLMEIFELSLQLCCQTRDDFLPENIEKRMTSKSEWIAIESALKEYVAKLPFKLSKTHLQFCKIRALGETDCLIEMGSFNTLTRFLQNIIKNAIEANATSVIIHFFDKGHMYYCFIEDNGDGINPEICPNFFQRQFPSQNPMLDLEAKRGEGTLMAFQEWEMQGGSALIRNRDDGVSGTIVELKIPCFFNTGSLKSENLLIEAKFASLHEWKSAYPKGKLIVIADDCLINLKILFRKAAVLLSGSKIKSAIFNELNQENWQKEGLVFDIFETAALVCCANAEIALMLAKNIQVSGLITDVQMPGKYTGVDLARCIREYETQELREAMPIVLHSALTAQELANSDPILSTLGVDFLLKGAETKQLEKWILSWTNRSLPKIGI